MMGGFSVQQKQSLPGQGIQHGITPILLMKFGAIISEF